MVLIGKKEGKGKRGKGRVKLRFETLKLWKLAQAWKWKLFRKYLNGMK